MELFIIEGKEVKPSVHALIVYPFSEIWERDQTDKKAKALAEYKFIELMCSMKKSNPYRGYSDSEKPKAVARSVFKDEDYIPDDLVREAIIEYQNHINNQLPVRLFNSVVESIEGLISFFNDVDLNERTKSGSAVYKPTDVTRAVSEASKMLASFKDLEQKIEEEEYTNAKTKGNRTINYFEKRASAKVKQ